MAPITVAFDVTFPNRNGGGTNVYTRCLLAALREREDVSVCEASGPAASNIAGTARWLLGGARRVIAAARPDLLHCPSFVAPWLTPVPFVVTVHDAAPRRHPSDHPLEWRVYDRFLMPSRLREAARVIAGCDFSRREVVEAYGLKPERVVSVPHGVDPRYFQPEMGSRDRDGESMLFPGAPIGRKNLESVLLCMGQATPDSRLGRASLDISGAMAQDFPHLVALSRSLGVESRVRWLGQVPNDDMPSMVAGASVVVYPSLYEGFGFPPLEAMAVGTPVVAANRGSLPEVLGDAALQVDPTQLRDLSEAIEAVLSRPDLRERLREKGRRWARRFTWERCAEMTCKVYRDVLEETNGA